MRQQTLLCIATLVLMVASLVLVAADGFVLPGVKHEPISCPICALTQCLATDQLSLPVLWIEPFPLPVFGIEPSNIRWLPLEAVCILWNEFFSHLFCARAPPLLIH